MGKFIPFGATSHGMTENSFCEFSSVGMDNA